MILDLSVLYILHPSTNGKKTHNLVRSGKSLLKYYVNTQTFQSAIPRLEEAAKYCLEMYQKVIEDWEWENLFYI